MSKCIYNKHGFVIFRFKDGYIVHNTCKAFEEGHTHIYVYKDAKRIIYHAYRKTVPTCYNARLIESLIRISNNADFVERLVAVKVELGDFKGYNRKLRKEEKCWKKNPRKQA